jgi:hypothetical protein
VTKRSPPRRAPVHARVPEEALFATRGRGAPFGFVLELLARADPYTRPMFGCTAVYVGEKIVMVLRDRRVAPDDDGVWLATTREHHQSLRRELPGLRSITVFGARGETGWQVLPVDSEDFEESVRRVCAWILAGDPRIGKIPKPRRKPLAPRER